MADFCKRCAIKYFGEDTKDFAGLCKEGYKIRVLCEGCGGFITVDHTGERILTDSIIKC